MNLIEEPKENVKRYIDFIYQHYQKQYGKYSRVHENLWQYLTVAIIALGFLPALAATFQGFIESQKWIELFKIIPPALASILAAFLASFKIFEKFRLREHGRLYFTDLVTEAMVKFSQCKTDQDYSQLHDYLRKKVTGEQYRQMHKYFGLHEEGQ